jgi:hypothetical protein
MGLLNLSAIRYILGTIISGKKNANTNPNMIVQLKGPQNTTLSHQRKYVDSRSGRRKQN